jgi:hypothetical protein
MQTIIEKKFLRWSCQESPNKDAWCIAKKSVVSSELEIPWDNAKMTPVSKNIRKIWLEMKMSSREVVARALPPCVRGYGTPAAAGCNDTSDIYYISPLPTNRRRTHLIRSGFRIACPSAATWSCTEATTLTCPGGRLGRSTPSSDANNQGHLRS